MKPRWVEYANSPEMAVGINALVRQLQGAGSQAPADVLGPISALEELEAICASIASGRGSPNRQNRGSLMQDVLNALSQIGPQTTSVISALLSDFKKLVAKIPAALDSVGDVMALKLATGSVLDLLKTSEAVSAAWLDVVSTFTDEKASADDRELRLMQLAELAEFRGVDYESWAEQAEWILMDQPSVMARLGEVDLDTSPPDQVFAGVSESRRLELCRETLGRIPEQSRVLVWLALADAPLHADCLANGPIQVFAVRSFVEQAMKGQAKTEEGQTIPAPPELTDNVSFAKSLTNAATELLANDASALVRVDFEKSTPTEARRQAQTAIRSLIDLSSTSTTWRLLDGDVTWTGSARASGSGFTDPETDPARKRRRMARDNTRLTIQQIEPKFLTRWLDGDTEAQRGVENALWGSTLTRTQSPGQRIILAVRAVEHTLGSLNSKDNVEGWVAASNRYLRAAMVDHMLLNDLQDALFCALNAAERHPTRANGLYEKLHEFATNENGYQLNQLTMELAEALPQVMKLVQAGSMQKLILREANELLDKPEVALARIEALGLRVDRLLARTSRERNALVHGTGVTERVLRNVDDFAVTLAQYASEQPLLRIQEGRGSLDGLELDRVRYLKRYALLKTGHSPVDVLWE